MTPVARMPSAIQHHIVLYVDVQMDGQEILIQNAINVGYYGRIDFSVMLTNIFLVECQVDKDCPLDKACKSQECVDPCQTTSCGTRAICEVEFHTAICVCPAGLQGNPLVACIEAGCTSNPDCPTNAKCDFVSGSSFTRRECQTLCNPGKCAFGADCTASDHRENCHCKHPLIGDGYVTCIERKCQGQK